MDWPQFLLVALVLGVAAFVQSATGFGLALVAVAALQLVLDLREAIALIAVFNLLVCVVTLWFNRLGFCWRSAWPLALGMSLGIPIGYYFLHSADRVVLVRSLGVTLVLIAVLGLRLSEAASQKIPRWTAFPLSIFGGVLGGAFNVGGPPIVAYAYAQPWSKTQTVAVLQVTFLSAGLTRNVLMAGAGEYTPRILTMVAIAAGPAFLGIFLGRKLLDRLPKPALKLGVFVFILIVGLRNILWPEG